MRWLPVLAALAISSTAACGDVEDVDAGMRFFYHDATVEMPEPDAGPHMGLILIDHVYDGDTVRLRAGSTVMTPDGQPMNQEHVRLLGVDAPEIAHPEAMPPTFMPDCWGDESAAFANNLLAGQIVTLDFDPQHELRDPYNRLLGYVILSDMRVANEVIIRQGQGRSFRAFNHRDLQKYDGLEAQAKAENLGLWAACPH